MTEQRSLCSFVPPGGNSSMGTIQEMESPVECFNHMPNLRLTDTYDTSRFDLAPQTLTDKISRNYLHEHTALGPETVIMTCPNCLMAIESIVRYTETRQTHLAAACLFPFGLCALPYCTPYFRNAEHYCPMCRVYLGTSFAKGTKALKCCAKKEPENCE